MPKRRSNPPRNLIDVNLIPKALAALNQEETNNFYPDFFESLSGLAEEIFKENTSLIWQFPLMTGMHSPLAHKFILPFYYKLNVLQIGLTENYEGINWQKCIHQIYLCIKYPVNQRIHIYQLMKAYLCDQTEENLKSLFKKIDEYEIPYKAQLAREWERIQKNQMYYDDLNKQKEKELKQREEEKLYSMPKNTTSFPSTQVFYQSNSRKRKENTSQNKLSSLTINNIEESEPPLKKICTKQNNIHQQLSVNPNSRQYSSTNDIALYLSKLFEKGNNEVLLISPNAADLKSKIINFYNEKKRPIKCCFSPVLDLAKEKEVRSFLAKIIVTSYQIMSNESYRFASLEWAKIFYFENHFFTLFFLGKKENFTFYICNTFFTEEYSEKIERLKQMINSIICFYKQKITSAFDPSVKYLILNKQIQSDSVSCGPVCIEMLEKFFKASWLTKISMLPDMHQLLIMERDIKEFLAKISEIREKHRLVNLDSQAQQNNPPLLNNHLNKASLFSKDNANINNEAKQIEQYIFGPNFLNHQPGLFNQEIDLSGIEEKQQSLQSQINQFTSPIGKGP